MLKLNILLLGLFASARSAMEGFIVGGQYAKTIDFAHSAFLDIYCISKVDNSVADWICGASIVNQKILLTAAHCLHSCSHRSRISIHVGNENRESGQIYEYYSFLIHVDYNPQTQFNDICLVRVQRPLALSRKASRVALMKRPPYREKATVAGWGVIDETSGRQSELLKFVNQKVMSRNACLRIFGYLEEGTICAAAESNEGYAAQGDSGSALMVRGYIQIGLVSYKIPSISKSIVIYTDVGYYYDWIEVYAKELICNETFF